MITVQDHPDKNRYEIHDDDQLAGFADYTLDDGQIVFSHTEVDPAFGGRGLAGELVIWALDDARRRGLTVLPVCSYVRKVISSEPEKFVDLVPASERERFQLPQA